MRDGNVEALLAEALEAGFFAGVPLGRWYPELADCLLVSRDRKANAARKSTAWPRRYGTVNASSIHRLHEFTAHA